MRKRFGRVSDALAPDLRHVVAASRFQSIITKNAQHPPIGGHGGVGFALMTVRPIFEEATLHAAR
jgi:hypothetical protein